MTLDMPESYRVGDWRFEPSDPVLRGDEGERPLEDRAARTLAVLCARRGEVVSKDDLIQTVWQGRSVSGNSVAVVIGSLRRALDDDPRNPKHIVTVGKRGYRLAAAPLASLPTVKTRGPWLLGGAIGLAAVALVCASIPMRLGATDIWVEPVRNDTGRPELAGLARALDAVVASSAADMAGARVLAGAEVPRGGIVLRSRLIIWAGAPELAMSAADQRSGTIIWSSFAAGPPQLLARHVDDRLRTLRPKLQR